MAGKKKEINLRDCENSAAVIMEYTAGAMRNAEFTEEEILEMKQEILKGYVAAHENLISVTNRYIKEVNDRLDKKRRKKKV